MSKFKEALERNKEPQIPGKVVDIDIDCQHCWQPCEEVKYYPTETTLIGVCSQGHKSMIEGFDLPL